MSSHLKIYAGVGAAWNSMPQYFKIHGYYTAGTGKVYHPGEPPNNDPPSWTETYNPRGQQFIKKPHYVCKAASLLRSLHVDDTMLMGMVYCKAASLLRSLHVDVHTMLMGMVYCKAASLLRSLHVDVHAMLMGMVYCKARRIQAARRARWVLLGAEMHGVRWQ